MATYLQVTPTSGDAQVRLGLIQRSHLSYIRLDEGTDKLIVRRELETLIGDHLCSVPHREKFTCPNFGDILRRSIDERPEFKASGAVQAFDALERYALNIITQPWRQEYFSIRLYSGFYKHSVEFYLSCVEEILYLMGYEPADGMELRLNDDSVDADRVTDIALNCLIAAVECQIMMQILENVGGSFSWKEIARVRRHYVGGPEKAADVVLRGGGKLSGRLDKSKAAADGIQHVGSGRRSNGYVRVEKLVDVPGMWTDGATDVAIAMEADERYPTSYGSSWERKSVSNGGGSGYQQRRPIPSSSINEDFEEALSLMHEDRRRSLQMDDDSSQTRAESWGFVDQSLEREGYNKDYGERGDLLKGGATATTIATTTPKYKNPIATVDYPLLPFSDYRNAPATSYATQKRPRTSQPQALSYGRLPGFAKSSGYGSRAMAPMEPTMDDLIELDNPSSNLGFHPGMFTDPVFRAINMAPYPTSGIPSSTLSPPLPQQLYHPLYAAILHPTATPQQMNAMMISPNFYSSMDRYQHNIDLLTAVPPPPPVKHSTPHDIIEVLSKLQLEEDGLLQPVAGTGTRDSRRTKKSQSSAEHRRSTYDNLQADNLDTGPTGMPVSGQTTLSTSNNPVSPPSPIPPLTSAIEKRSVNGGTPITTSSATVRNTRSDKTKDVESDRLEIPSRRSSQSSSSTTTRDQRGSSGGRESVEKSRSSTASSSASSKPRHERSASVGSTRSASGAKNSDSTWHCWVCTYLNSGGRDVCEMCSRSRYKGAESAPLSSGGHECQNCTLVNEKGARKCTACNCNLENSPTYV